MEHNIKNQLTEIYSELEKFTQTLNFFRENFFVSTMLKSETIAEEVKLINILTKYDLSTLAFVVNEIEYRYESYRRNIKFLRYVGIVPLIAIFGFGVFLLCSSYEFSTQTIIGLWIMLIASGAVFLRGIFILPSIFKANRCLFLLKQAIALKKEESVDLTVSKKKT